MEEINIPKRKCKRCGHEWYLSKPTEPVVCAKCRSPYWNRDRIR